CTPTPVAGVGAGYLDCNSLGPGPNTDGCECYGDRCCAGKCPYAHSNGSYRFWDCSLGFTLNPALAMAACMSEYYTNCVMYNCGTDAEICGSNVDCTCWVYSGPDIGHVKQFAGVSACTSAPGCPSTSDPSWY